jgi:hypothetical protein
MSQDSYYQRPLSIGAAPARRSVRGWTLPGVGLLAAVLAVLAGCGPDTGPAALAGASGAPGAHSSAASGALPSALPSAPSTTAPTGAKPPMSLTAAPACPAVVQPQCPAAPAAAPASKVTRRLWARHRGHRWTHRRERASRERFAETGGAESHVVRTYEESSESDRTIVRRHGDFGSCPRGCPGGRPRDWDFTGIDARGYLVWPGKVEY